MAPLPRTSPHDVRCAARWPPAQTVVAVVAVAAAVAAVAAVVEAGAEFIRGCTASTTLLFCSGVWERRVSGHAHHLTLENVLLQWNLSTNEWVPYIPFTSPASVLVAELVCVLSSLHRVLRNSDVNR